MKLHKTGKGQTQHILLKERGGGARNYRPVRLVSVLEKMLKQNKSSSR